MEYIKTYIEKREDGILVEVTEHHDKYGIGYTCRTLNRGENKKRLTGQSALDWMRVRGITSNR